MEDLIGNKLGQYEIREKIGEGGMAQVFKAYQPSLNRFVAVKVLAPITAEKKDFIERFQREAYSVARLEHPNIVPVHDFGVQGNYSYIVMRYIERSRTLDHLIKKGTPLDKLFNYIIQVADALNYAHEQGAVHRDVKPSNILIDGKWALLSDFGLVKMSEATTQLTGTGFSMGTPAYMSPEQVDGINVDYRTDIYALGIILYKILTGTIPHDAPTPIGIFVRRKTEPVPPLRQIKPDISESLEQVTLRSLAMKPAERYRSAADFGEALKKAQTDPHYREKFNGSDHTRTILTVGDDLTVSQFKGAASHQRRGPIIGGAIAALIIIGLLVFSFVFMRGSDGSSAVQSTPQSNPSENSVIPVIAAETDTPSPPTPMPTPIPASTPQAVAQTKLEIRDGPGDEYDLLGYLPVGSKAEITGQDETAQWWQIRTGLATTGVGWIKASAASVHATDAANVPIALAPPTPTGTTTPIPPTPTSTATLPPTSPTATPNPPTATAVSTLVATPAITKVPTTPTAPPVPAAPDGQFTLLKPTLGDTSTGPTEFEWQWNGSVELEQGFEVRVWREGEPPSGAHNAVEDNKNGYVAALNNHTYRLNLDIREAAGVRNRGGEYLWTVVLVQISPEYKDLGIQATPGRLTLGLGGGGGGGGSGGGGGGTVN